MAAKNFDFECAVVTGGGSGIGFGIAKWLLSEGKKVIIAGRTESKLQSACKELGATAYYVLDTGNISAIPDFVDRLVSEHPEVDCLVNNAGVQRQLSIQNDPVEEFLEKADQEIDINIRGPMHLALRLLPHLKSKAHPIIVNVSSVLGFIPFSVTNPVYNGTKAWLHFWSMTLRTQLKDTNIRVIEIAPPTVGTELHRDRADPDDNKKEKNPNALTIEEFMDEVTPKWKGGDETIGAGIAADIVQKWERDFGSKYREMTN